MKYNSQVSAGMSIPPWYILSGIGSIGRKDLCSLISMFENTSLLKIGFDKSKDLKAKLTQSEIGDSYLERIQRHTEQLLNSRQSDALLRFRLWDKITSAFELSPSLPLSTESAHQIAARIADHSTKSYDSNEWASNQESERFVTKVYKKAKSMFSKERIDFSEIVRTEAIRFVSEAFNQEDFTERQRSQIESELKKNLDGIPTEFRDRSVEHAIKRGDLTAAVSLLSGGGLVGLGVAVKVAGFSAYILAAKASAVIPLLGGKTAVSALAVFANPVFAVSVILGGGYYINRKFTSSISRKIASGLVVQLTIQGLANSGHGLVQCLNDFKGLSDSDISNETLIAKRKYIQSAIGDLPPTPGEPCTKLPSIDQIDRDESLSRILYGESRDTIYEAMAVAGLNTADILFNAVSIDPLVLKAADFSRIEDLDGIFKFGAFANQIRAMSELKQEYIERNLIGYVAEMVVSTRLQQYDVSFPDTSNNPGFDLLVDGNPFQVKCYSDSVTALKALDEHFEKYPDIPVYVNSEVLPAVTESNETWADSVFGVEGFDYETTNEILTQSLDAGAALSNTPIPVFAITCSLAKNVHRWWKGSIPLKNLPLEAIVDGTIKGSLSAAGGYTGGIIGLLLFGPAGAVIFSGVGGPVAILGSNKVRYRIDSLLDKNWVAELEEAAQRFQIVLDNAMSEKMVRFREKSVKVDVQDSELKEWINLKFSDRELAIAEYRSEFKHLPTNTVDRANELLRLMHEAGVHPQSVNRQLQEMLNLLSERPTITDHATEAAKKSREFLDRVRSREKLK